MRTVLFLLSFILIQDASSQVPKRPVQTSTSFSLYLQNPNKFDRSQLVVTEIDGKDHLSFLVEVKSTEVEPRLEELDIKIGTKAGQIWTLLVPLNQVQNLNTINGLEYIELDRPIAMFMDKARAHANVDSAHAGHNLALPLSGKDVVVGIIDAGFEYMHPSFYDTSGAKLRVKRIWEQKKQGTPPSQFAYGNEIIDTNAMRDSAIDHTFSHGTHVGGIAAGSGIGSDSGEFLGIAYESDLVFVGIRPEKSEWTSTGMSSIIDGVKYIYDYATSVNKPAVVNLSWGGSTGPNDGSSLFAQALEALTGPGRLFVNSAGNNGGDQLHLYKSFSPGDTLIHSFHDFGISIDDTKRTWIDLWGEANREFCVQVALYRGSDSSNHTDWFCLDQANQQLYLVDRQGDTCFLNIAASRSDFNGKAHMLIDVYNNTSDIFSLKVASQSGEVHVWSYLVHEYVGYAGRFKKFPRWGNMEGDDKYVLGAMACANEAITVAAYSSKPNFSNYRSLTYSLESVGVEGDITSFSSKGPTTNHRLKPNIAAPGMVLASGINKHDDNYAPLGSRDQFLAKKVEFNGEDYWYAYSMGTSMSSPMVAGVVALMLEANPKLTPGIAQYILKETASRDSYTTANPDSSIWGYGKLNAYRAVKHTLETISVDKVDNQSNGFVIYPNPNNGNFTILSDGMEKGSHVSIYDLEGKKIVEQSVSDATMFEAFEFDAHLRSGTYLLELKSRTGRSVQRLIVHP